MTKRDYDLIAACINAHVIANWETEGYAPDVGINIMHDFAKRIASELLNTNPRFHMSKFLTACGVVHEVSAKQ